MNNNKGFMFILLVLTLSFTVSATLGYDNPTLPRIGLETRSCLCSASNNSFNATYADDTYWKLDGTNAPPTADWNMGLFGFFNVGSTIFNNSIFVKDTGGPFSGAIQISTQEGGRGLIVDGEVTDGIICEGFSDTTTPGLVNSFCTQANTLVTPSINNRTWWSYGSAPFLNGTSLMNEYIGFLSNPVSRDFAGLSFRGTIRNVSLFEAGAGTWNGGNVTNFAFFKGTPIPKTGGNWTNLYGLWLPDMTDGTTNNFAIKTGKGLVSFNGRTNITDDGNVTTSRTHYLQTTEISCGASNEGTIYYNITNHKHYGCNSTAWNSLY